MITPIIASHVKFASMADVKTRYLAQKPPNGGTPAKDKACDEQGEAGEGILLPMPGSL